MSSMRENDLPNLKVTGVTSNMYLIYKSVLNFGFQIILEFGIYHIC